MENENWKPVPGYESRYEVSDLGRVKSLKGTPKILRPGLRRGYPSVVLAVNTVKRNRTVHTLVMEAFVGPPPEGHEVSHEDGDRANPRLGNLKHVTHRENQQRMVQHGMSLKGEKHHKTRLTEAQVREVRDAPSKGVMALGRKHGMRRDVVDQIRSRRTWKHLD